MSKVCAFDEFCYKIDRDGFQVHDELTDSDVTREKLFMNTPKRAKEVACLRHARLTLRATQTLRGEMIQHPSLCFSSSMIDCIGKSISAYHNLQKIAALFT